MPLCLIERLQKVAGAVLVIPLSASMFIGTFPLRKKLSSEGHGLFLESTETRWPLRCLFAVSVSLFVVELAAKVLSVPPRRRFTHPTRSAARFPPVQNVVMTRERFTLLLTRQTMPSIPFPLLLP